MDPSLYNVASSKGKEHMLRLLQTVHGMLFTRGRPPTHEAKEELLTGLLSAAQALQADRFSDESFKRQNGILLKVRKYAPLKLLKFIHRVQDQGQVGCSLDTSHETLGHGKVACGWRCWFEGVCPD